MSEELKMPWGKFKGREIHDLSSWYLKWIAENVEENFANIEIVKACDEEWQYRDHYNCHID